MENVKVIQRTKCEVFSRKVQEKPIETKRKKNAKTKK